MKRKLLAAISIMSMMFSGAALAERYDDDSGAVYAMTNAPDDNKIIVFDRDERGALTKSGWVSTHGKGSGGGLDPLASQGSLVLTKDQNWLLAANAGSQEISVLRVTHNGLKFADKASVAHPSPASIASFHDLVYVLGNGSTAGISGYRLSHSGHLTPLANSIRLLGAGSFSQISFDPSGDNLLVTDKGGNRVLVYALDSNGRPAAAPVASATSGAVPFAFTFDRHDHLLVVEAATNTVSSYNVLSGGHLEVISPLVANGQKASCWIASNGRHFVFTANPGTHSISSFHLDARTGQLSLIAGVAGLGTTPLDLETTKNGRFLYALDPSSKTIDAFEVQHDGSLSNLGPMGGDFSTFAQGIAVR